MIYGKMSSMKRAKKKMDERCTLPESAIQWFNKRILNQEMEESGWVFRAEIEEELIRFVRTMSGRTTCRELPVNVIGATTGESVSVRLKSLNFSLKSLMFWLWKNTWEVETDRNRDGEEWDL